MGKIDDRTKELIIDKLRKGMKQREIARELQIGQSSIHYIWKRYMKSGDITPLPKSGRKLILSPRDRRLLTLKSKKNPFFTPRELQNSLESLPKVSIWTVRRSLQQSGLFSRIACRKPMLTRAHVKARLSWCKAYATMTVDQWKKVVFSDESRFECFSNRRRYVRRPIGTRYVSRYVCQTVKFPNSVMVWGSIKGDGTKTLVKCPPRLDSMGYQSVLEQGLLSTYDPQTIFMQDGASCHKSKSTLRFLDQNNICVMVDWPPQSPDLNLIENLWSIVKDQVSKRAITHSNQLWTIVQEEYSRISSDIIASLYESMPTRIKAVLKNKGLHCKY